MSDQQFSSPFAQQQPIQQPAPKKNNNVLIIILVLLAAMSIPCMGVCVALLLPAVQAAREAARRVQCANNMKQIGVALHNYHDVHRQFPAPYSVDANGNPLHSWRTHLLPFMDQAPLYEQIDLDKPWDDPANQRIAKLAGDLFYCPSTGLTDNTMTTYMAVVDPSGMMAPSGSVGIADCTDGALNTIMFVEVSADKAAPWMKPQDIDLNAYINATSASEHLGGGHVCFVDGSVAFLPDEVGPDARKALVTKNGGESVSVPMGQ